MAGECNSWEIAVADILNITKMPISAFGSDSSNWLKQ